MQNDGCWIWVIRVFWMSVIVVMYAIEIKTKTRPPSWKHEVRKCVFTPTHTASVTSLWQDLLVKWSDKERAEHVGSGAFTQPVNAASFLHRQLFFRYFSFPALPLTGLVWPAEEDSSFFFDRWTWGIQRREQVHTRWKRKLCKHTHTYQCLRRRRLQGSFSHQGSFGDALWTASESLLLSWLTGRKAVTSRNLWKRPENVWLDPYLE